MTQKLNPAISDAMIEAGANYLDRILDADRDDLRQDARRIYTAMESARDPDELREALEQAKAHLGAGFGDHPNEAIRQSNINRAWHILDDALTALSRNVGDVG